MGNKRACCPIYQQLWGQSSSHNPFSPHRKHMHYHLPYSKTTKLFDNAPQSRDAQTSFLVKRCWLDQLQLRLEHRFFTDIHRLNVDFILHRANLGHDRRLGHSTGTSNHSTDFGPNSIFIGCLLRSMGSQRGVEI